MATIFEITSPILNGEGIRAMQAALNLNGYTDMNGNRLTEDGKWGAKSQAAFDKIIKAHSAASDKPDTIPMLLEDAAILLSQGVKITVEKV